MSILRHALLAAFFLGTGCAAQEQVGEAEAAIGPGIYRCTVARGTTQGTLVVHTDGTCVRHIRRLAGASEEYCPEGICPSCLNLSESLECLMISPAGVPLNLPDESRIYHCTLAEGSIRGSLVVRPDGSCGRYNTPLVGASHAYCTDGVCPSCAALGRDIGCTPGE